jgi:dolichol-phosphate mannosyltransferase
MSMAAPELSVVVPVYNAEDCLRELHARLTGMLRRLVGTYEIILVDDGSVDGSWAAALEIAKSDHAVRAYRLSRNFGQHAAITAGLQQARGERAVLMDCDLEDPPEEIPRLYAKALEGWDIVLARRKARHHSLPRRFAARAYFTVLGIFNRTRFQHEYGTFSVITRKVITAYLEMKESARHYLLLLYWLGFPTASVDYEQGTRFAGRSAYGIRRLLRHALDGIFFQTTVLLRWIVYLGFAVALCGFSLAAFLIQQYMVRSALPGWTSLAVLILIVGGVIIMSVGVTGLYIGRIFDEVRGRPLYVVSESVVDGVPH